MDLVQAQIKIAGGATLSEIGLGDQAAVGRPNGYAIQCRVTTEDPSQNFQVRLCSAAWDWGAAQPHRLIALRDQFGMWHPFAVAHGAPVNA